MERSVSATRPVPPDKSSVTQQDISRLVDAFYREVRADTRLGPIFEHHVGTTDAEWAPHLARIEGFWSNVMLGGRAYRGNPMQTHMNVPGIEKADFDHWLALFDTTAVQVLPEAQARAFSILAHRIAQSLWMGLQRARSDGPPILR